MTKENTTGIEDATSIIVKEEDVHFDTEGRAVIENVAANAFIKETLAEESAIEISEPGERDVGVDIICPKNLYCPKKPKK